MNIAFSFIIVDDSELDCYVTKKFLERSSKNLNIKTFQNAEGALEMIRENQSPKSKHPAIILLDLLMPGMNGFKFVEEFEKFPVEIQQKYIIIILTVLSAVSHPNDIFRILANGAVNSIIEKPLTNEKLISLLNNVRSAN
ncbi:MAG: two-component system response regulator [Sphingobacteriales bacterium]